jgi:hypothetical protein
MSRSCRFWNQKTQSRDRHQDLPAGFFDPWGGQPRYGRVPGAPSTASAALHTDACLLRGSLRRGTLRHPVHLWGLTHGRGYVDEATWPHNLLRCCRCRRWDSRRHDSVKRTAYASRRNAGDIFILIFEATHGRLGMPAMQMPNRLRVLAACEMSTPSCLRHREK